MSETRVVILDVDGTLMDTNYLHVESWVRAMEKVGYRVARYEIHREIGKGSDQLLADYVDEDDRERVDELHGELYAEVQHHSHPLPGAAELVADLDDRGYGVWLATSAKPDELEYYLKELDATERISGVVNSSDVEESKPAPDIFGLALEKSGVTSEEAVAIGDAVWDVESAGAAGVRTVAVLTGGAYSSRELKDAGAYAVYQDCSEILASEFPE